MGTTKLERSGDGLLEALADAAVALPPLQLALMSALSLAEVGSVGKVPARICCTMDSMGPGGDGEGVGCGGGRLGWVERPSAKNGGVHRCVGGGGGQGREVGFRLWSTYSSSRTTHQRLHGKASSLGVHRLNFKATVYCMLL